MTLIEAEHCHTKRTLVIHISPALRGIHSLIIHFPTTPKANYVLTAHITMHDHTEKTWVLYINDYPLFKKYLTDILIKHKKLNFKDWNLQK